MNIIVEIIALIGKFSFRLLKSILIALLPNLERTKDIRGEKVLVTGAASGLGRLLAVEFAKLGSELILLDLNGAANEDTATLVRRHGVKAHVYQCDVSKREEIYSTAQRIKKEVGNVDILVNNAGIVTGRKLMDCPDECIEKTMQVNAMSHIWATKCFLPSMISRNHGHIVSIGSAAGLCGVSGQTDYCASKFAVTGFIESLQFELLASGNTGVHTTLVCPYYINTGMFQGVRFRFPSITPILEPEWVVKKTMSAILTNKHQIILPASMALTCALKGLIPINCYSLLLEFVGANNAMDTFQGHPDNRVQKEAISMDTWEEHLDNSTLLKEE